MTGFSSFAFIPRSNKMCHYQNLYPEMQNHTMFDKNVLSWLSLKLVVSWLSLIVKMKNFYQNAIPFDRTSKNLYSSYEI